MCESNLFIFGEGWENREKYRRKEKKYLFDFYFSIMVVRNLLVGNINEIGRIFSLYVYFFF